MTHGDGGKGDTMRPTDHAKYANNWELIWGKRDSSSTQGATNVAPVMQTDSTQTEAPTASPVKQQRS